MPLTLTSRLSLASPAPAVGSASPAADGRRPEPFSLAHILHHRHPARLPFSSHPRLSDLDRSRGPASEATLRLHRRPGPALPHDFFPF